MHDTPSRTAAELDAPHSALVCAIGGRSVAVDRERVAQVIDLAVTPPPPLSMPLLGGVSVVDGRVVMLVSIADEPRTARRHAGAVLLSGERAGLLWALEIGHAIGFVNLAPTPAAGDRDDTARELWLAPVTTAAGAPVLLLDLDELLEQVLGERA